MCDDCHRRQEDACNAHHIGSTAHSVSRGERSGQAPQFGRRKYRSMDTVKDWLVQSHSSVKPAQQASSQPAIPRTTGHLTCSRMRNGLVALDSKTESSVPTNFEKNPLDSLPWPRRSCITKYGIRRVECLWQRQPHASFGSEADPTRRID